MKQEVENSPGSVLSAVMTGGTVTNWRYDHAKLELQTKAPGVISYVEASSGNNTLTAVINSDTTTNKSLCRFIGNSSYIYEYSPDIQSVAYQINSQKVHAIPTTKMKAVSNYAGFNVRYGGVAANRNTCFFSDSGNEFIYKMRVTDVPTHAFIDYKKIPKPANVKWNARALIKRLGNYSNFTYQPITSSAPYAEDGLIIGRTEKEYPIGTTFADVAYSKNSMMNYIQMQSPIPCNDMDSVRFIDYISPTPNAGCLELQEYYGTYGAQSLVYSDLHKKAIPPHGLAWWGGRSIGIFAGLNVSISGSGTQAAYYPKLFDFNKIDTYELHRIVEEPRIVTTWFDNGNRGATRSAYQGNECMVRIDTKDISGYYTDSIYYPFYTNSILLDPFLVKCPEWHGEPHDGYIQKTTGVPGEFRAKPYTGMVGSNHTLGQVAVMNGEKLNTWGFAPWSTVYQDNEGKPYSYIVPILSEQNSFNFIRNIPAGPATVYHPEELAPLPDIIYDSNSAMSYRVGKVRKATISFRLTYTEDSTYNDVKLYFRPYKKIWSSDKKFFRWEAIQGTSNPGYTYDIPYYRIHEVDVTELINALPEGDVTGLGYVAFIENYVADFTRTGGTIAVDSEGQPCPVDTASSSVVGISSCSVSGAMWLDNITNVIPDFKYYGDDSITSTGTLNTSAAQGNIHIDMSMQKYMTIDLADYSDGFLPTLDGSAINGTTQQISGNMYWRLSTCLYDIDHDEVYCAFPPDLADGGISHCWHPSFRLGMIDSFSSSAIHPGPYCLNQFQANPSNKVGTVINGIPSINTATVRSVDAYSWRKRTNLRLIVIKEYLYQNKYWFQVPIYISDVYSSSDGGTNWTLTLQNKPDLSWIRGNSVYDTDHRGTTVRV
jgi:hypothetical protein